MKPDFFIVGAPRSGTSSLYSYLSCHPQIEMASPPNTHIFGSDLDVYLPRSVPNRYEEMFSEKAGIKRRGDVSVFYLYSTRAAEEIHKFAPKADIIIMLRNPVEMVYSLHSLMVFLNYEPIVDFERALDAESERVLGKNIPEPQSPPGGIVESRNHPFIRQGLFYTEFANYSEQVKRYLNIFGKDNIHVILFDRFASNTAAAYRELLQFLNVDDQFAPDDFQKIGTNTTYRCHWLHRSIRQSPEWLRKMWRALIPYQLRDNILQNVYEWNIVKKPRAQLALHLRQRLEEKFAPQVRELAELIGLDLNSWLTIPQKSKDTY